ncbi:MAG: gamma-glutamyltransferase [Rhodospirillales bacterium]
MTSKGAVASGHAETSRAAAVVLAEGGNAFDAALAAMCAACVAEPVLASLGGGGFLLARPGRGRHQGRTIAYDFVPQTPRSRARAGEVDFFPVHADFGPTRQEFHIGMGSIATPGIVRGLFEIHRDLGSMPMRDIVAPAVELGRTGVRVDRMQAYMMGVVGAILLSTPASRALFESRDHPGRPLGEGEMLLQRDLAETLEVLAIEGADLFYRGEIASRIVDDCRGGGGWLTAEDLKGYRVERRTPLAVDVLSARLQLNPPPSTGGILIAFALELLRDLDPAVLPFGSAAYLGRLAQVMRLTNRARLERRLHELTTETVADTLLDPTLIAAYRARVLGHPPAPRGTTHISVIDAAGNAASLSLSNGEGSGHVIANTGIVLNNVLGEEDINPHGFHRWPEDVRIGSMMAPTLVLDRDGSITALGSGGSNRIRTAVLQVLLDRLVFAMPLIEAVAAPRIHVEDDKLSIEPGYRDSEVEAFARPLAVVDRWPELNMFFGGVHAVRRGAEGGFEGAGDPRRGGTVGSA